jgi:putative transposase
MTKTGVVITARFKLDMPRDDEIDRLFSEYQEMVNELLGYCVERRVTGYMRLTREKYREMREKHPNLHSMYICDACRTACSIYKGFRKRKRRGEAKGDKPTFKRVAILLHKKIFTLDMDRWVLSLSTGGKGERRRIRLFHTPYHEKFKGMKQREAYLVRRGNEYYINISFIKEVEVKEPDGKAMGIDLNENNVTFGDSDRVYQVKTGEREIRTAYYLKRRRIQKKLGVGCYVRFKTPIPEKARKLLEKYRERQKRRVEAVYHMVANEIIRRAVEREVSTIVMENLKNIEKTWRRQKNLKSGKRKSRHIRGRLNRWSFRRLQFIIEYKAKLAGLNVVYVNPKGTSSTCPICGVRLSPNGHRLMRCPKCGLEEDRDVIAVRNLLRKLEDVGAFPERGHFRPEGPYEMTGNSPRGRESLILK